MIRPSFLKIARPLLCLGVLATAWSLADAAETPAKRKREGTEVLISADAIEVPEGLRPKPGKPIYYILRQGKLSLGDSVAGVKLPDTALVERLVDAELKKQGFIKAEIGGPVPAIFILATYGDANFTVANDDDIEMYMGMVNRTNGGMPLTEEETRAEAARLAYINSARAADKGKIVAITGASKVNVPDANGMKVMTAANEDRYYLTLAALDADLYRKKERKLLWRTSMSIDWRKDLAASLPVMLESAGPSFGLNTTEPVFLDDRDRREATVKIGDAVVVPDDAPATKKK